MLTGFISEKDAAIFGPFVICALTTQRCVAPGSKVQAQRWFPRPALPERLGVAPAIVHNTRTHRVLDRREALDAEVQDALVRPHEQRERSFATLTGRRTSAWWHKGHRATDACPRVSVLEQRREAASLWRPCVLRHRSSSCEIIREVIVCLMLRLSMHSIAAVGVVGCGAWRGCAGCGGGRFMAVLR